MGLDDAGVDIALYVALSEEFHSVRTELGRGFAPVELTDVALTCFIGTIPSEPSNRSFRIVVVPAGKMGTERAANVTSTIIDRFKPKDVVVLGIAGALADELQPGDVFIPDRVVEYLANAATVGTEQWTFQTSGNHFATNPRLLNRWGLMPSTHGEVFGAWQRKAVDRFKKVINKDALAALKAAGLQLRPQSELVAGDDRGLASGPAVGKGKAFVSWLKSQVDRKLAAIEMESAGVYDAAFIRTPAPRVIAIRGISDFADERKAILETSAKGGFRTLAVKNAITIFIAAVKAGVFESDVPPGEPAAASGAPPAASLVRNVFVIGGATGETDHVADETGRLQMACFKLGEVLAKAGARMIVCSPFPDSADYYAVTGYYQSGQGGVIEFHSPKNAQVEERHGDLVDVLGEGNTEIVVFGHPGYEDDESRFQAWLLAQLLALERADVVVAIGGKISKTANTLLHLAEGRRLPIVPYTFLKGAAQRAFARRDWQTLHPKIDVKALSRANGVEKVIEIANQLLIDAVSFESGNLSGARTVFISRAKEDATIADGLATYLRKARLNVLMGETSIGSRQLAQVSIEQSIKSSNICVFLWSKHYALSPWCYDELEFALDPSYAGHVTSWLFSLDDTPIVPKVARKLRAIRVRTVTELLNATRELLGESAED
jgi:nucleoside phosphorylase